MTSPYRQQIEQARQQRDAELAEAERIYAIAPAREKGRQDLAALLEAAGDFRRRGVRQATWPVLTHGREPY